MSFLTKSLFLIGILLISRITIYSQSSPDEHAKLEKIIPIAPTAASIAKYGNIPVNYFTGSPNVNIPLLEVNSGSLKIPIELNYQYNGLKVEEIASWVGLGWSLQAGGVISRSVRGIEDENANGYITIALANGMTTKFIIDSMLSPTQELAINDVLRDAGQNEYDLEPDIYYFSFPGGSGKFFYNQEDKKFYSVPAQNVSISTIAGGFLIVAENGSRLYFTETEHTWANSPQCSGSQAQAANSYTASSWYLRKIENATQTDSVTFEYTNIFYDFDNLSTSTKYYAYSAGGGSPSGPIFNAQLCWQNTEIEGKRLSHIRFRNGYVKFTPFSYYRCDLYGDKALDKIELFNSSDQLIKRFRLSYGYFGTTDNPTNCTATDNTRRLKLKTVWEESSDSIQQKPYEIVYNEEYSFPNRLSYSQDHWGYYNGATSNSSLIPSLLYQNVNGAVIYQPGDDRKPNFTYAKLGSIKNLAYPTGGSTEFEFENNEVSDTLIQPEFAWHTEHIEGDHNGGIQTIYIDTFEVNEPSNYYNFNNPSGGAYVDFLYSDIGCDLSGGASSCAVLTCEGISSGTSSFGPFISSPQTIYLANGTYILKATFNQNPPLFEDFYFSASWRQPSSAGSNLVGGIRLKKLTDYDSVDANKKIIRKFSYVSDIDSLSSGEVCGYPNSYLIYDFRHEFYENGCPDYFQDMVKISSTSNYPLIAHGGSYVGYKQVTATFGENGENGRSIYKYSYYQDLISDWPHVASSREWLRGLLLEDENHKKASGSYSILTKDTSSYLSLPQYDSSHFKISYGLKPGFKKTVTNLSLGCGVIAQNLALIPIFQEYETITGNSQPISKYSEVFEGANQISNSQKISYNDNNYLPKETKAINSKGDTIITRIKYNIDYTTVSNNPAWLYQLSTKSITTVPVEKLTILKPAGGTEYVTGGLLTYYKSDKPFPDKIYAIETNTPIAIGSFTQSSVDGSGNFIKDSHYKETVSINGYDSQNNIKEQQKINNIKQSYIWDYKSSLPVAECINADSSSIAYTSFEADGKGGWTYSGSVNVTYSITGSKSYLSSGGNVTRTGLTSATYIVSYWGRSGSVNVNSAGPTRTGKAIGDWTYYEHEVTTTSITVSGSNYIDELRLYPKSAQMTSYTYTPLIGMTSQSDASGHIIFYEYDSFNRLKLIKDEDGRILKRVDYKYQANFQQ